MNDNIADLSKANEAVQRAAKALTEFGHILAGAMKPMVDAVIEFGRAYQFIEEQKKKKYLAHYRRRGERMRKRGK